MAARARNSRPSGEAGYEVIGVSAPGPFTGALEASGIRHVGLSHATRSMAPVQDPAATVELYRLLRRLRPGHPPHPQSQAGLVRAPGGPGWPACRSSSTRCTACTPLPDDPWPKRTVVYGLERTAAAFSDGRAASRTPRTSRSCGRLARARVAHPRARQRHRPGCGSTPSRLRAPSAEGALEPPLAPNPVRSSSAWSGDSWPRRASPRCSGAAASAAREPPAGAVGAHRAERAREGRRGRSEVSLDRARGQGVRVLVGRATTSTSSMPAWISSCWPRTAEGFPRAAMEAAAMGVPIVATDIRGCRQVVDDGSPADWYPPRDAERLAAVVAELVADPEGRAKGMANAARDKAIGSSTSRARSTSPSTSTPSCSPGQTALAAVVVEARPATIGLRARPGGGPVLQVVTSTDRRGAEVAATQLDHALAARGRRGRDGRPVARLGGPPARAGDPGPGRRRPHRAAAALVARVGARRVLVGHGSATLPFGAWAATMSRTPFVYRSIGDPAYWAVDLGHRARSAGHARPRSG